jgi:hypothetical protein
MNFSSFGRAALCAVLLFGTRGIAAAQSDAQNQPPQTSPQSAAGTDQRRAGGQKSITGCLMKGDAGFVVKAQEGTYQLNTDRDLSAYVGKQVRIESKWDVTGTLTTSPMDTGSAASATAPPTSSPTAGTPAFVGDLHLHITGTVLGDCAAK